MAGGKKVTLYHDADDILVIREYSKFPLMAGPGLSGNTQFLTIS